MKPPLASKNLSATAVPNRLFWQGAVRQRKNVRGLVDKVKNTTKEEVLSGQQQRAALQQCAIPTAGPKHSALRRS
jgi:hypothetical protein